MTSSLRHFDESQLWFQLKEIVEERTTCDTASGSGRATSCSTLAPTSESPQGLSEAEAGRQLEGRYRGESMTCELRTLSAVLREASLDRVDLLKIDVERAELDVLRGIQEEDWAVIRQIVLEIHDEDDRCRVIAGELRRRRFRVVVDQEPAMRGTDVHLAYARRG